MSQTRVFRPPSVPLVTVDPYFSVWSAADRLYDSHTVHWTGKRCSMVGLIRIDGKPRKFMGKVQLADDSGYEEPAAMEQTSLRIAPLSSTYTFAGDGIELEVDFMTPLLLDDLELLSRPASYISFRVRSADGKPHEVALYVDAAADWCVHTPDQQVVWNGPTIREGIVSMRMGTEEQPVLQRAGDDTRIDWGYCYMATPHASNVHTAVQAYHGRERFLESGRLPEGDGGQQPRAANEHTPVMAAIIDFGRVDERPSSHFVILAYDDIHSIEYFGKPLDAYWRRNGTTFDAMLGSAAAQYSEIRQKCEAFNRELADESRRAGGQTYAELLSLAYRQAIAAHKLVWDRDGENVLFFSKENFSNGCIGTVDVSYPSIPLFLRYNPELVKGMMRPIFRYADSEAWTFDFAPHDVGCYPKANGQVYGENKLEYQMPIEECGNMLIMAAAVCVYENDARFAEQHWNLLAGWADYLLNNGLNPENQLCTDDFAGHLAQNANLSVKAIVGIGAFSIMCGMLGKPEGERYLEAAREMARAWEQMANAGDHYKLTFDSAPETWSLKYNLVWDRLFGLHLFPKDVFDKELAYYETKQNEYGIPLDNRNTYTKSDWLVWSASMAASQQQFERMIEPLRQFLHHSPSRVPFTDWYDTTSAKQVGFQNRSVVGGLFIRLLGTGPRS